VITWLERLQQDETLQTFVSAELACAGIRVDTLAYQNDALGQDVATLTRQLDAARAELRVLRRRGGRSAPLDESAA
jgi:hypothetical protein